MMHISTRMTDTRISTRMTFHVDSMRIMNVSLIRFIRPSNGVTENARLEVIFGTRCSLCNSLVRRWMAKEMQGRVFRR